MLDFRLTRHSRPATDGKKPVLIAPDDPYGGLASSTGLLTNPFRFGGQYQDSESGLYYLRARYFDPATAQFISMDPLTS